LANGFDPNEMPSILLGVSFGSKQFADIRSVFFPKAGGVCLVQNGSRQNIAHTQNWPASEGVYRQSEK